MSQNGSRKIEVTDLDAESTAAGTDRETPAESNVPAGESPPHLLEMALSDEELHQLCMARVCPACEEKTVADDARLRMFAEMDNFKKRMQRDKDEFIKYADEKLVGELIPVLDTLDLALHHGGQMEACKNLVMGVEMTRKMFLDILSQHGLAVVGAVGEEFTPERHEALGQEPRADLPPGCVAQVVSRGYLLKDRLVRPAKVLISGAA